MGLPSSLVPMGHQAHHYPVFQGVPLWQSHPSSRGHCSGWYTIQAHLQQLWSFLGRILARLVAFRWRSNCHPILYWGGGSPLGGRGLGGVLPWYPLWQARPPPRNGERLVQYDPLRCTRVSIDQGQSRRSHFFNSGRRGWWLGAIFQVSTSWGSPPFCSLASSGFCSPLEGR